MGYDFTERQLKTREWVRAFAEKEIAPRDKWMDENGFDHALYERLCESGLMGLRFPAAYGGGGAETVESMLVIEEIARCSASAAFILGAHWLAAGCILVEGTEDQKKKYITEAAQGRIFAFGLTEEAAGSDAGAIQSIATRDGEQWVLNGGKLWITNSGVADYYVVLAKTNPKAGTRGISAFILPKDSPGLVVGNFERKMGMRGATTCKLSFDNIHLPMDSLLGQEGKGFKYAMASLDGARITIAALATGISRHAFEVAKAHALVRQTFGSPLASHQAIQFYFADMSVKLAAGTLLVYDAARRKENGERHNLQAAQAKLFCTEACSHITNKCLQILGGNGYSQEYPLEQLVRDARILEICEGSNEIQRMVIGGAVLN